MNRLMGFSNTVLRKLIGAVICIFAVVAASPPTAGKPVTQETQPITLGIDLFSFRGGQAPEPISFIFTEMLERSLAKASAYQIRALPNDLKLQIVRTPSATGQEKFIKLSRQYFENNKVDYVLTGTIATVTGTLLIEPEIYRVKDKKTVPLERTIVEFEALSSAVQKVTLSFLGVLADQQRESGEAKKVALVCFANPVNDPKKPPPFLQIVLQRQLSTDLLSNLGERADLVVDDRFIRDNARFFSSCKDNISHLQGTDGLFAIIGGEFNFDIPPEGSIRVRPTVHLVKNNQSYPLREVMGSVEKYRQLRVDILRVIESAFDAAIGPDGVWNVDALKNLTAVESRDTQIASLQKLLDEGQLVSVEGRARRLLVSHPGDTEALFILSRALRGQNRFEEARRILEKLVSENVSYNKGVLELADTYKFLGAWNQARDKYTLLINQIDDSDLDERSGKFEALMGLGEVEMASSFDVNPEKSLRYFEKAAALDPKSARPWISLGAYFQKKAAYDKGVSEQVKIRYFEEAKKRYMEALKLDPKNDAIQDALAGLYIGRARNYIISGWIEDAIKIYKELLGVVSDKGSVGARVYFNLGVAEAWIANRDLMYLKSASVNPLKPAIKSFRKALELLPKERDEFHTFEHASLNLIELYIVDGNYSEAEKRAREFAGDSLVESKYAILARYFEVAARMLASKDYSVFLSDLKKRTALQKGYNARNYVPWDFSLLSDYATKIVGLRGNTLNDFQQITNTLERYIKSYNEEVKTK